MFEISVDELVRRGVLSFSDGYRTKRSEHGRPGYRILRVADVLDGRIRTSGEDFVSERFDDAIGQKKSQPGDVLLTTKGTVGRVAIYPPTAEQVAYSPQLCYFRIGKPSVLSPRFLAYWLKSPSFLRQAAHRANNTDMAAYINLKDIGSLRLSIPEIGEQRAIAEVLGAFDAKITANDRLAEVARRLARTSYRVASVGAETLAMSDVLEPILGGTPSRADDSLWDGKTPWVSAKDITGAAHGVVVSTSEGISARAASVNRLRPLPAGSVVLTARGTVGEVARLGISASVNQSCYGFLPGAIPTACLGFVVEDAAAQARSMVHGSVFDTITMNTFVHVRVPQLSASQWTSIESKVAPLVAATQQAVVENERLGQARNELLPLLMSGKVRVRDAEKVVGDLV